MPTRELSTIACPRCTPGSVPIQRTADGRLVDGLAAHLVTVHGMSRTQSREFARTTIMAAQGLA